MTPMLIRNSLISSPYPRQSSLKTIPFTAAHTYIYTHTHIYTGIYPIYGSNPSPPPQRVGHISLLLESCMMKKKTFAGDENEASWEASRCV